MRAHFPLRISPNMTHKILVATLGIILAQQTESWIPHPSTFKAVKTCKSHCGSIPVSSGSSAIFSFEIFDSQRAEFSSRTTKNYVVRKMYRCPMLALSMSSGGNSEREKDKETSENFTVNNPPLRRSNYASNHAGSETSKPNRQPWANSSTMPSFPRENSNGRRFSLKEINNKISNMGKEGKWSQAVEVFEAMPDSAIQPNTVGPGNGVTQQDKHNHGNAQPCTHTHMNRKTYMFENPPTFAPTCKLHISIYKRNDNLFFSGIFVPVCTAAFAPMCVCVCVFHASKAIPET